MSDTTYNKFQHYGTNAERLAFVPSPPAATQPIYIWYETDTGKAFLYHTAWVQITGSGLALALHAATHAAGGTDEVTLAQSQITGLVADLAGKAAAIHAPTHIAGGSDPISVVTLAGYPGGTTNFLRADGTFSPLPAVAGSKYIVGISIDGGGAAITTGIKAPGKSIPISGNIIAVRMLADQVGSIVVDIWKDTYVNYPPVVADTITAAAKPTISAALKSEDVTLTGWIVAVTAGDILRFNVDSAATITKLVLELTIQP